jgi:hypothetical protein
MELGSNYYKAKVTRTKKKLYYIYIVANTKAPGILQTLFTTFSATFSDVPYFYCCKAHALRVISCSEIQIPRATLIHPICIT